MATIGRKAAVARIVWPFHANWSGFMAWMTWMLVHIFFLIGFRNRYSVFLSWAFTYITERDGVRLIVGSQNLPGWDVARRDGRYQPQVTKPESGRKDCNQRLRQTIQSYNEEFSQ